MRSCDREPSATLRVDLVGLCWGVDDDKAAADNARHAREQTGYADR